MSTRPILVLALLLAACAPPAAATVAVPVTVTAGPVCPVVTDPPDPSCDDRPVAGAELVVRGPDGRTVTTVRSDDAGHATLQLAPGSYVLVPQPVEGLMGTAEEMTIVVTDDPEPITVGYDTGIR